jgi:magnesium transporter
VEDSKQFGQRGKLQIYRSVAIMAGFGPDPRMREPVEVHCYYTTRFLITLRRAPSPALDALRREASVRPLLETHPVQALHRLVGALHEPLPAFVLGLGKRLDALEHRVLPEADDDLTEITAIGCRRWPGVRQAGRPRSSPTLTPGQRRRAAPTP